jgi:DNA-binding CsgD family transcriptional regulator
MFDLESSVARSSDASLRIPEPVGTFNQEGLLRAPDSASHSIWLLAALDEVDYGMLLVGPGAQVVHCNYAARVELDEQHPLQLIRGELRARNAHDSAALLAALRNATQRGLRKLLTVGRETQRVGISLVPLAHEPGDRAANALVILGKRKVCEHLSIQAFALDHDLTAAETRVLVCLCDGDQPAQIAVQLGVAISTVRTQIGSIRLKTGAGTIRALVQQLASLPPLMGTLRGASNAAFLSKARSSQQGVVWGLAAI